MSPIHPTDLLVGPVWKPTTQIHIPFVKTNTLTVGLKRNPYPKNTKNKKINKNINCLYFYRSLNARN